MSENDKNTGDISQANGKKEKRKYPRKLSRGMNSISVKSAVPKRRQELLKWNGWGYKDSMFVFKDNKIRFLGNRYPIGEQELPYMMEYVKQRFEIQVIEGIETKELEPIPSEDIFPKSIISQDILDDLEELEISYSIEGSDRLVRSHGQSLHEIASMVKKEISKIPDVVVWPTCHEEVVELVKLADKNNLVIIPVGGATSVSGAIECPKQETRPIISLDTSQMNDILWVDHENLVVCCESGIIGQDLERELKKIGYTTGHEPDSYEFSSLGGWVATRASGMKKNTYGNIEDIVVHVKMVTPRGVLEKNCKAPRISCGPNFEQIILGSEGSLGVVTEVVIKVRPVPKCTKYGSVVFPDFESGVRCLREVARQRCQPSSIRLMDNEQFHFGQALKLEPSYFGLVMDEIKKFYLTKIKGFDMSELSVATLLFEGSPEDIAVQEKKIYDIAIQNNGIPAGEKNGERGYVLTFVIAYIRDMGLKVNIIAESFETSVPWDRCNAVCRNVKHCINKQCISRNLHHMVSCRVTQTYDAGCCIYFYFAFKFVDEPDPLAIYEEIEAMARDEIISSGGSISHHHGVGKIRKKWYKETVSTTGVNIYRATKAEIDPKNIFANANLTDELGMKSKL